MTSSVLARGARGGGVVVVGQLGRISLQLIGTVILARLLSPADFGLVAMVLVFTAFGALLRDFGIATAALQARNLTYQQASNLFWFSTGLSALVAAVLALSTPLLMTLYDEPRLALITPILAVGLLIDGAQSQVQMQLARSMKYVPLTLTDLLAQSLGLGSAIVAAIAGWGYWALVGQVLVASVTLFIGRTIAARWLPTVPRRGHDSRRLLRVGADFGLAQLLAFGANNADTLIIGARFGATDLGFYNRAFQLYALPRTGILDPLTQVAVPAVNGATASGEHKVSHLLLRVQFALSLTMTWIYVVAAATAPALIPLVLGPQWQQSVILFQLLAIGGVFASFGTVSYWTFVLEDKSRSLLHLHLVTKPITIALLVAAAPFGLQAVALAFAISLAISWPINLVWLARTVGQDSWAFLRVGLRVIVAGIVAFPIGYWGMLATAQLGPWISILAGAIAATLIYFTAICIVPGGRSQLGAAWRAARAALRPPNSKTNSSTPPTPGL